jgi:hypothetical protein
VRDLTDDCLGGNISIERLGLRKSHYISSTAIFPQPKEHFGASTGVIYGAEQDIDRG